jgi:hypothetical protein
LSAPAGIDPRQLALISGHALRHSMRSGSGLVFVLLALFFGLSVAHIIISPIEALSSQGTVSSQGDRASPGQGFLPSGSAADVERQIVGLARNVVFWALAPSESDDPAEQRAAEVKTERWVDFVLDERPALLSAILFIVVFGMPLLISFGAFNQTSGDIGNRGLRYQLLRTDRANIFYGRFLATAILTAAAQALVVAIVALYLGLKIQIYDGMAIAGWSLQGYLALVFLSMPYVAVCAWISAGNDSPMVSLVLCKLAIGGVLLVAVLGQFAWEPLYYVNYLLPWGIQNNLLAPDASTVALTAAACVGYTAVYVWLGARKFRTRDL